jgi:hypothetical protein
MVLFDQVWGMYLRRWFPRIVAFRVAFPFEEVL